MVGASLAPAGDQVVTIELWDYATSSRITAGSCRAVADNRCNVPTPASQGQFGQWLPGPRRSRCGVRYTAAGR